MKTGTTSFRRRERISGHMDTTRRRSGPERPNEPRYSNRSLSSAREAAAIAAAEGVLDFERRDIGSSPIESRNRAFS